MKYILPGLLLLTGCFQKESKPGKTTEEQSITVSAKTYDCNYNKVKQTAQGLFRQQAKTNKPIHQQNLIRYVADTLFNCWYGTPWDFNGTTRVPGNGKIACGYFVTTVLQDAGVKINRVALAQSASEIIIRKTCESIDVFSYATLVKFVAAVKHKGAGLYIVGLDFHTGFIYFDGVEVYFIHASYAAPKCVVKEVALKSSVLNSSKYRIVGRVKWEQ